jgi:hypothetical protein
MLWDLNEGRHLSNLEAGDTIHALCFSPIRYWLCAATASTIKIWDLESRFCVDELKPEFAPTGKKAVPIQCISLAWSADGATLFAGCTILTAPEEQCTENRCEAQFHLHLLSALLSVTLFRHRQRCPCVHRSGCVSDVLPSKTAGAICDFQRAQRDLVQQQTLHLFFVRPSAHCVILH